MSDGLANDSSGMGWLAEKIFSKGQIRGVIGVFIPTGIPTSHRKDSANTDKTIDSIE
jgi:hypothetical protein